MEEYLLNLLKDNYEIDQYKKIIDGYKENKYTTFRINLLKANKEIVLKEFKTYNYELEEVNWCNYAYVVKKEGNKPIRELDSYLNGYIYLQSLSSMLPVIVLDPKKEETILDMAASPGSKTTQMAMVVQNKALITAVEKNKIRENRLKYNLNKQGVTSVTVLNMDATKIDDLFSFDKVLLDSPCSGSGTITKSNQNYNMFNEQNLANLKKTQVALLTKALKVLKKGHTLVYSTCSILPLENEEVLKEVKKQIDFAFLPIELDETIPLLPTSIPLTKCICPSKYYEGFFLAHLIKK